MALRSISAKQRAFAPTWKGRLGTIWPPYVTSGWAYTNSFASCSMFTLKPFIKAGPRVRRSNLDPFSGLEPRQQSMNLSTMILPSLHISAWFTKTSRSFFVHAGSRVLKMASKSSCVIKSLPSVSKSLRSLPWSRPGRLVVPGRLDCLKSALISLALTFIVQTKVRLVRVTQNMAVCWALSDSRHTWATIPRVKMSPKIWLKLRSWCRSTLLRTTKLGSSLPARQIDRSIDRLIDPVVQNHADGHLLPGHGHTWQNFNMNLMRRDFMGTGIHFSFAFHCARFIPASRWKSKLNFKTKRTIIAGFNRTQQTGVWVVHLIRQSPSFCKINRLIGCEHDTIPFGESANRLSAGSP